MPAAWLTRRHRVSSVSATAPSAADEDEAFSAASTRPARRSSRALSASASGAAGLSSSYNLPSRSYIHHVNHGRSDAVQYSSSAVREQTAELASSFLSESDMSRAMSSETTSSRSAIPLRRGHGSIEEHSEPPTPADVEHRLSLSSANSEAPSNRRLLSSLDRRDPMNHRLLRPALSPAAPDVAILAQDDHDLDHDHDDDHDATEASPLLPRERLSSSRKSRVRNDAEAEEQPVHTPGNWSCLGHRHTSPKSLGSKVPYSIDPKRWSYRHLAQKALVEPITMLPAVLLGLLLNLLDALSYGIILFPLGEEVFSDMGADGVSMFYVSCIVSQLVYSSGSIFRGGVGSEMIEVVPFFHKMTYMIIAQIGTEDADALRATVITSYAMSAILTGVVFFALGSARLGTLVNFFPHSILTGCIGGVGIFLFVTGIEVSARMDGTLEPTMLVLRQLFAAETLVLWIPPLALAIILLTTKHFFDRPWLVPAFYITITAIFYVVTTAVPSIDMAGLRASGWVFEAPAAGVPFYNFYSYYKFELVNWSAIAATIPSQLALTFFGILHVPINVPNLAMVMQEDNVSINRELIMHGISNTLSGCVGSIQNYLVFVNSVLFVNTGANSRLAGYMLAAATFGLWVAGPVVIGYVPVMVVGTLIYMLGIDLTVEALVSSYGRLYKLEYFTIIVIALVMGLYDFVVGIALGIGLACLVYVVQTSRKTVIRAEFSGNVAESTVRRHPRHRDYLHKVGKQIRVVKLGGYLFFGSIVKVEKTVRGLVDAEAFAASPIRYLIIDFTHVTGIDFSAAEAFNRMNRILHRREVTTTIAGVSLGGDVGKSLQMVGLFVQGADEPSMPAPKVFEDLNSALEACENELLMVLTEKQRIVNSHGTNSPSVPIPDTSAQPSLSPFRLVVGSPRRDMLHAEATTTISENPAAPSESSSRYADVKQPLQLLLQTTQDLTSKGIDFWFRATPYFTRHAIPAGTKLYSTGDPPDAFYLLESGMLRADYALAQGGFYEHIVAGTTCGELPFFSGTRRTCDVVTERESVVWMLTVEAWDRLQAADEEVARELLKVGLRLSAERMSAVTSYVLITAS